MSKLMSNSEDKSTWSMILSDDATLVGITGTTNIRCFASNFIISSNSKVSPVHKKKKKKKTQSN